MSIGKTINTDSPVETRVLGEKIGETIKTGAIIALTGDLGSGKTVFVQGLAKGLDVPETYCITSPTYTLMNEYPGRLRLFHIDLYRIGGMVDLEDLGFQDIEEIGNVCAIEWAEKTGRNYFSDYMEIKIEIMDSMSRKISINAFGEKHLELLARVIKILK